MSAVVSMAATATTATVVVHTRAEMEVDRLRIPTRAHSSRTNVGDIEEDVCALIW